VHDVGVALRFDEALDRLDVLAAAGSKAEVVNARTVLIKAPAGSFVALPRIPALPGSSSQSRPTAAH